MKNIQDIIKSLVKLLIKLIEIKTFHKHHYVLCHQIEVFSDILLKYT